MCSVIVAYIWGAYIFKETIQNHTFSLLSVLVMMIGMVGLGTAIGKGTVGKNSLKIGVSKDLHSSLLAEKDMTSSNNGKSGAQLFDSTFMKGIGLATLVGLFNGSSLIPLKYAHKVGWNQLMMAEEY